MGAAGDIWRFHASAGDVEIELHPRSLDRDSLDTSVRILQGLTRDLKYREPAARRTLLAVHARLRGMTASDPAGFDLDTGDPRAEALGEALLAAARSGALVVRHIAVRSVVVPLDAAGPVDDALGPLSDPLTWIEIELVDNDGLPVPGASYVVECADGTVRTGTTNAKGFAREEGVKDGQCQVSFPDFHAPHWAKS